MKMNIEKIRKANAKVLSLFEADKKKYDIKRSVEYERLASLHLMLTCGKIDYRFWAKESGDGRCDAGFQIVRLSEHVVTICDKRCDTIKGALHMYDLSKRVLEFVLSDGHLNMSDINQLACGREIGPDESKAGRAGMWGNVV